MASLIREKLCNFDYVIGIWDQTAWSGLHVRSRVTSRTIENIRLVLERRVYSGYPSQVPINAIGISIIFVIFRRHQNYYIWALDCCCKVKTLFSRWRHAHSALVWLLSLQPCPIVAFFTSSIRLLEFLEWTVNNKLKFTYIVRIVFRKNILKVSKDLPCAI